ncbi:MAG: hypothetical protein K8R54_05745 [Bacteroidales bacterium]|nr:hypothetical protein [Bacteroidales bacterium]
MCQEKYFGQTIITTDCEDVGGIVEMIKSMEIIVTEPNRKSFTDKKADIFFEIPVFWHNYKTEDNDLYYLVRITIGSGAPISDLPSINICIYADQNIAIKAFEEIEADIRNFNTPYFNFKLKSPKDDFLDYYYSCFALANLL